MARLDFGNQEWVVDENQPASAVTSLSKDHEGNPVFVATGDQAYVKKNGQWEKIDGCNGRLAWGGDGSLYKRTCEASNYGYIEKFNGESNTWSQMGDKLAYEVSADEEGNPWIVAKFGSEPIMKWDSELNEWHDMLLEDAYNMAAGPDGHVYGTAPPNFRGAQTLYRWGGGAKWTKIPTAEGVKKVAVGENGLLYYVSP